jgi:hypothetical protein
MENSWQNFVKDLQISVNMQISNLNPHREYILKDNQLRKKIILNEIKSHNFNSPFDVMDQNNIREYYDTNLLIDQLKTISDIFNTIKSFPEIMDKKEKLELTKKIITQYLNYLVSNHFEQILNELVKLNTTEIRLNDSLIMIKGLKNNLLLFKDRYIKCSMKIVLNKQKYNNLCKMKNFLEGTLDKWRGGLKEAKKLKIQGGGYSLFQKYTKIQNDIAKWKNEKDIDFFKNKKNNFLLPDLLIQKLKKKMENIKIYFDDKISLIFTEKQNDLQNIYYLFCIIKVLSSQDPMEAFKIALKKSMRDTIFNTAKNIISQNINNVYNINVQNINKFSVFKLYSLKEQEFFNIIYILLSHLINIAECYHSYEIQEKGNNIGKLLVDSSPDFYQLFEKKVTKIISLLSPSIETSMDIINVSQPFIKYISCINIFTQALQYYFNCKESKYIKPYLTKIIQKQFNFQIKYFIKKICVFLGSDIWKRIPYEEKINPNFLGMPDTNKKNSNNNNNNYQKFMSFYNKESFDFIQNINSNTKGAYENIPELFNKFINEHEDVLSNIKYNNQFSYSSNNLHTILNLNINIEKESKKSEEDINTLISSKDILSGATITTIRFVREFLENIFLYNSLKDYIFKKALIIFEYYFIGSLNILMFNKQYFEQIFKSIDLINMKKPNGLYSTTEFALFLENFMDLKRFLLQSISDLSELYDGVRVNLFEDNNKLNNTNVNELLEQNKVIFPKLNPSMPLDTTNKYCLLIESLVLVESVYSLYKYIKKYKRVLYDNGLEIFTSDDEKKEKMKSTEYNNMLILYKKALKQLASYLYRPLCHNILIIHPILKKISLRRWDIKEKPKKKDNNGNYINLLIIEIIEKLDKLELLSGWSLTEKSFLRFFYVLIDVIINFLIDTASKIKNWSEAGRNLFYEEMETFKTVLVEKLKEKNLNANVDIYFEKLFKYIKAWFYNEEQIMTYINEERIEYKYVRSIIENGAEFKNKNNNDKKKFLTKIEEMYYGIISALNERLLEIK